jgi:decaprenyl-phosphate phosphoribosyltransferase
VAVVKLIPYVELLRPRQWLKNLMLYFPPFLGGTLLLPGVAQMGLQPLASFCLASSATYILNDLRDCSNDSHHPEKKLRPLPSGRLSPRAAAVLAIICAVCSGLTAWGVPGPFLYYLIAYVVVSIAYSLHLKEIALVDIFCISAGFLIRLLAGGAVFGVVITEWLFMSVFLLSVFLSTGKRLSEKQHLGDFAKRHRKALVAYPNGYLEGIMYMTGGSVLVTYTMYVITQLSSLLLYSVPLCCFGLLRYIIRIKAGKSGDPTDSLTRDIPLLTVGVMWAVMVGWGIYAQ